MDSIHLRELQLDDYDKGYLQLLAQLTTVGDVTKAEFEGRARELIGDPSYRIVVAEDTSCSKIVGTATLIVEKKIIRQCGKAGHIEDVVVDSSCRGQKLGQRLIEELIRLAQELGCYKVILDCAESNIGFYERCGLTRKEVQMVKYYNK